MDPTLPFSRSTEECHEVLTDCLENLSKNPSLATKETLHDMYELSRLLAIKNDNTVNLKRELPMLRLYKMFFKNAFTFMSVDLVCDWNFFSTQTRHDLPVITVLNEYLAPLFQFFPRVKRLYLVNMMWIGSEKDIKGMEAFKKRLQELKRLESIELCFESIKDIKMAFESGIQVLSPGELTVRLTRSMKHFGEVDMEELDELVRAGFQVDTFWLPSDALASTSEQIGRLISVLCKGEYPKVPSFPFKNEATPIPRNSNFSPPNRVELLSSSRLLLIISVGNLMSNALI